MKYEYKTHAVYRGYGWIEPLTDSEDSLIEDYLARRICEELNTLQAEVEALRAERDALREALEMMVEMVEMNGFGRDYAMDVARAALEQGNNDA